jgi:hypothetical protein
MISRLRQTAGDAELAVALAIVFLGGLAGTAFHFQVASHDFCETHQQLRHTDHVDTAADHAPDAAQRRLTDAADSQPANAPLAPSHSDKSDGCQWLAWLNHTAQSSPAFQAEILYPHAAGTTALTAVRPRGRRAATVVPIEHVSPVNSPPTVG